MPPSSPPLFPIDAFPFGTHPGVVLRQWLSRRKLTQTAAAALLGMSRHNVNLILGFHRGISADAAIALGNLFGTGSDYWVTLQKNFEMHRARRRRQRKEEKP